MKFLYLVQDDFKHKSKIVRYALIAEDEQYFYCAIEENAKAADWIVEKKELYHVLEKKETYQCFGYDIGLIDFLMLKQNLKILRANPSWRNSDQVLMLKKLIKEKKQIYSNLLEG